MCTLKGAGAGGPEGAGYPVHLGENDYGPTQPRPAGRTEIFHASSLLAGALESPRARPGPFEAPGPKHGTRLPPSPRGGLRWPPSQDQPRRRELGGPFAVAREELPDL